MPTDRSNLAATEAFERWRALLADAAFVRSLWRQATGHYRRRRRADALQIWRSNRDRAAGARELAARLVGFVAARALLRRCRDATRRQSELVVRHRTASVYRSALASLRRHALARLLAALRLERALASLRARAFRILKRRRLRALEALSLIHI